MVSAVVTCGENGKIVQSLISNPSRDEYPII